MIDTVVPETKVPSHQGPDAQTVIPDLDFTTVAGAGVEHPGHGGGAGHARGFKEVGFKGSEESTEPEI